MGSSSVGPFYSCFFSKQYHHPLEILYVCWVSDAFRPVVLGLTTVAVRYYDLPLQQYDLHIRDCAGDVPAGWDDLKLRRPSLQWNEVPGGELCFPAFGGDRGAGTNMDANHACTELPLGRL